MLEKAAAALRDSAGIVEIADLGPVFQGAVGYSDCTVSAGIEKWQGSYFVRLAVTHSRGAGFRRIRVVKWPYSRNDAAGLEAVFADLRHMELAQTGAGLVDRRMVIGRFFDWLTRCEHLGEYFLKSPLPEAQPLKVVAKFARSGGQLIVTLTEDRSPHGFTLAQMPHQAIAKIRAALEAWAMRA